jgi:hypothetical protein
MCLPRRLSIVRRKAIVLSLRIGSTDAQVASTLNMVVAMALVKEIGMNGGLLTRASVKITDWDSGTKYANRKARK